MRIYFNEFMERAKKVSGCSTQMELAKLLDVNRSAITQAKNRDSVPEKWLLILARKFCLRPDWFENSDTAPRISEYTDMSGQVKRIVAPEPDYNPEIIEIPKVSAVLCAGAGSFEVDATIIDNIALPYHLARSFGSPDNLVFMDVSGDSMEPGICNGDTVLIDQSVQKASPGSIMAVGHEDTIYIKRLNLISDGGISLVSDNTAYSPINLYGDDLNSFRVIGKLVWLCRQLH